MATVKDVYDFLNIMAPVETKMDFDNVGFLVGRSGGEVNKILLSLDITSWVAEEAKEVGAQLIVSHHPAFFELKSVTDDGPGKTVVHMLENKISAICMHTNLDAALGGVNDALAKALGLEDLRFVDDDETSISENEGNCDIGRIGWLPEEMCLEAFLPQVKKSLKAGGLRYYDSGRTVRKVAVLGGSGGSELESVIRHGCDTFVTADVKYNVFLDAKEANINLIDAGHFPTENVVIPVLAERLAKQFPDLEIVISKSHGQTEKFI